MSHQQDVARRDVQHVRKDIVNTEGGLTPFYQSFIHYVWLAHSREVNLDFKYRGLKNNETRRTYQRYRNVI